MNEKTLAALDGKIKYDPYTDSFIDYTNHDTIAIDNHTGFNGNICEHDFPGVQEFPDTEEVKPEHVYHNTIRTNSGTISDLAAKYGKGLGESVPIPFIKEDFDKSIGFPDWEYEYKLCKEEVEKLSKENHKLLEENCKLKNAIKELIK